MSGLRWREEVGDNTVRVITGDAVVGPLKLGDAMVLELAEDGRARFRIRSVSRVVGPAAACPPAARLAQRLVNRRYLAAARSLAA